MLNRSIEIRRETLDTCQDAKGVVVVIDVLRAFTTAAYALDRGAEEIFLVSTVEEAFVLRKQNPDCLLIGEVNGFPIDGFDLPNSPSSLKTLYLSSRRLIQRTTAGTQGIVSANQADHLFAASLCVARATAFGLKALNPSVVTFVETGRGKKGGGEEDVACADYIVSLLVDSPIKKDRIRKKVEESPSAAKFSVSNNSNFPESDLDLSLQIDRFSFWMKVERRDGLLVLKPGTLVESNGN